MILSTNNLFPQPKPSSICRVTNFTSSSIQGMDDGMILENHGMNDGITLIPDNIFTSS
jgi:hypothetical protein